jgi:hypothetical protein
MARTLSLLLLLAAALAASAPTRAAESPGMGRLAGALLLGRDGPWEGAMEDAAYRLANPDDAGAVKHLVVDPRAAGWRGSIAVEVRIEGGEGSVAGLLYAFQPEPLSYLALAVDGGGVALYARSPSGLEKIAPLDDAKLDADGFNELRIEEGDGEFHIVINGARVGSAGTEAAGTGAVGIIAGGRGTFLFRNFTLTPAPSEEP